MLKFIWVHCFVSTDTNSNRLARTLIRVCSFSQLIKLALNNIVLVELLANFLAVLAALDCITTLICYLVQRIFVVPDQVVKLTTSIPTAALQ